MALANIDDPHDPNDEDGYRAADFQSLEPEDPGAPRGNLDMILDIPVTLSMEVGRRRMTIRDILKLSQGSVLELDRDADTAMDVMVNGTFIAQGEVVVVNNRFGIRLTDVVSMRERVKRLNKL